MRDQISLSPNLTSCRSKLLKIEYLFRSQPETLRARRQRLQRITDHGLRITVLGPRASDFPSSQPPNFPCPVESFTPPGSDLRPRITDHGLRITALCPCEAPAVPRGCWGRVSGGLRSRLTFNFKFTEPTARLLTAASCCRLFPP